MKEAFIIKGKDFKQFVTFIKSKNYTIDCGFHIPNPNKRLYIIFNDKKYGYCYCCESDFCNKCLTADNFKDCVLKHTQNIKYWPTREQKLNRILK